MQAFPRFPLVFAVLALFATVQPVSGAQKVGIVLLHGKGSTSLPRSPMGKLKVALEDAGFMVVAPDMPWSRDRSFDKDHAAAMAEIDAAVAGLRADGATRIVVGGHSIGAGAAIAYGATRTGLAGIMAIAPGHFPDVKGFQNLVGHDYRRALGMIAAGKGDEEGDFADVNQGHQISWSMTAKAYLSWFDPEGPAAMSLNATRLKPDTPLLWMAGEKDRLAMRRGRGYVFTKAPAHPKNAYIVVKGGHRVTPQKGEAEIIDWLRGAVSPLAAAGPGEPDAG